MALRLLEIFAPVEYTESILSFLEGKTTHGVWSDCLSEDRCLVRVLLPAEETEGVLDVLEQRFSNVEGFRVLLLPVEAAVPRLEPGPAAPAPADGGAMREPQKKVLRISRQELWEDVACGGELTGSFLVMVVLSGVVAAVGLLRDSGAVVIGAMVIAPLLGPNMALALGTALGDTALVRKAAKALLAGALLAFALALPFGLLFHPDPAANAELRARTQVGLLDLVLALATGGAGALAFTGGFASTLVGVMVAVALLPPLVTAGMMVGGGRLEAAGGALLLFLVNLICLNLSGVFTFVVQGVRPGRWWEAQRAGRATRRALLFWIGLLAVLAGALLLAELR